MSDKIVGVLTNNQTNDTIAGDSHVIVTGQLRNFFRRIDSLAEGRYILTLTKRRDGRVTFTLQQMNDVEE